MIKVGILTVDPHGSPWAEVLTKFPDLEMASVWDYEREKAEVFAKTYGVKRVEDRPEDVVEYADAGLIPGGRPTPKPSTQTVSKVGTQVWGEYWRSPSDHLRLARLFLEAGKPVNVDKPLADTVEDAREIIRLARENRAPLMSCSALRYASEVQALRELVVDNALGRIRSLLLIMGGWPLIWYGVHGVEAIHTILGSGVDHVYSEGNYKYYGEEADAALAIIKYADEKMAVLHMLREIPESERKPLWPITMVLPPYLPLYYAVKIFGETGCIEMEVKGKGYYEHMLREFIGMVKTGKEPIPLEHTLEITKILVAAQRSLETGKKIYLADL